MTGPAAAPSAPDTRPHRPVPFGTWRDRPGKLIRFAEQLTALTQSQRRRSTRLRVSGILLLLVAGGLTFGWQSSETPYAAAALRAFLTSLGTALFIGQIHLFLLNRRVPPELRSVSSGGRFLLLLLLLVLFVDSISSMPGEAGIGFTAALGQSFQWYNPKLSATEQFSVYALIAATVAGVTLWGAGRRTLWMTPDHVECEWAMQILKPLLQELPPNLRAEVYFMPIRVGRKPITIERKGRKPTFAETLLSMHLDLGEGRRFLFNVTHLRRSKGRTKHKGWKHKVKIKYAVAGERIRQAGAKELESLFRKHLAETLQQVEISEPQSYKFKVNSPASTTTISSSRFLVSQRIGEPVSASQSDCRVEDLLHPELVLATCRALSALFHAEV